MEAYMLVNTNPARIWQVADELRNIDGVKMAHAVTGPFDVVAYVEFSKMEVLANIIEDVQRLRGVGRTQTLVAIPPTIRE